VNGSEPPGVQYNTQMIYWQAEMLPGKEYDIVVSYKAEGVNSFTYGLYKDRRLDELDVTVEVSGMRGTEVLDTSLTPTQSRAQGDGDTFTWDYTDLVANRDIRLELPRQLSFAQRVEELQDDFRTLGFLAPFWVGLFLISLAGILWLSDLRAGLEVYLLMGLGMALFYPLLTLLSGLVHLVVASVMALVVISALEILFLGMATGWNRGRLYAAWLLLIFLGLFSLGILTPFKGLLVTVGGIMLVATFMILYARRLMTSDAGQVAEVEYEPVAVPDEVEEEQEPEVFVLHCPNCARALADDHKFCPGCGYDLQFMARCGKCDYEQLLPEEGDQTVYCLRCGAKLA
jgi:hypothetical protein